MGELRCARSVCLPFVLSAARHSVRRHAGHVMERPRLGFPFARSVAAQVNYSCVQIGHAILRRHRITGAVQSGNSVTHFVADATRDRCFDSGRPETYRSGWNCFTNSFPKQQRLRCLLTRTTLMSRSSRETWRRQRATPDWKFRFYVLVQKGVSTESLRGWRTRQAAPSSSGQMLSWSRGAKHLPVWAYSTRCLQSFNFESLLRRAA